MKIVDNPYSAAFPSTTSSPSELPDTSRILYEDTALWIFRKISNQIRFLLFG